MTTQLLMLLLKCHLLNRSRKTLLLGKEESLHFFTQETIETGNVLAF